MSGIAGIVQSGGADRPNCETLIDHTIRRNPLVSTARSDQVSLGHWLADPEPGCAPQVFRQGKTMMAADARLDYREELAGGLGVSTDLSDAQLILAAYEKWGVDAPSHLFGDFAFAIWDADKQQLFCARDVIGVRPFYYRWRDGCFSFCTQIRALVSAYPRTDELIEAKLGELLLGYHVDRERTLYPDISRLPPGSTLSLKDGQLSIRRYWQPEPRPSPHRSAEDLASDYRQCFQAAVAHRMRGQDRIGCYLSGGVDSTMIGVAALEELQSSGRRLHGYTWALAEGDDWQPTDCRAEVDRFLEGRPIEHRYIISPGEEFLDGMNEWENFFCGPNQEFRHFLATPTYDLMREQGIRTVLAGDGGDYCATYLGQNVLLGELCAGSLNALVRDLPAVAKHQGQSVLRMLRSELLGPLFSWPRPRSRMADLYRPSTIRERVASCLLRTDYQKRIDLESWLTDKSDHLRRHFRNPIIENQLIKLEDGGNQRCLETIFAYPTAGGIEHRFPMFDRKLIELSLGIPPRFHLLDGSGRGIVRRAFGDRLPSYTWEKGTGRPVVPDLLRRLCNRGRGLGRRIQNWKSCPAVVDRIDLESLEKNFHEMIAAYPGIPRKKTRKPGVSDLLRTLVLASFLERSSRRGDP